MAKPGRKPRQAEAVEPAGARERLVEAAFETLRSEGFSGASARLIADRAGVNQSQIFYYFGSVNSLLIAALERSSRHRLAAMQDVTRDVTSLEDLFVKVEQQLQADIASGQLRVLAELIAGSATDGRLKEAVADLVQPWITTTQETLERVAGASVCAALVPGDQLAFAVVSLFMGMELLMNLRGDTGKVHELFATGKRLASLLDVVLPAAGSESRRRQRNDRSSPQ